MKHNLHAIREGTMKVVFLLTACISILAVALICIFLFANGIPTMHKIGLGKFLFGMTWAPNQDLYGIFPMIIASILVTGGAILIGVPLGLLCALYLARFCPKRLLQRAEARRRSAGRHPVHCLWLLRPCRARPGPAGHVRQRQEHRHGLHHARHHDPADHHQRLGIVPARRAGELLRGLARAGRNA